MTPEAIAEFIALICVQIETIGADRDRWKLEAQAVRELADEWEAVAEKYRQLLADEVAS